MIRDKVVPKKSYTESRLDSGTALSDPAALSEVPVLKDGLAMPNLENINQNHGATKSRYNDNELQLKQPNGFPIIPLESTLNRAREEAELEATAKRYVDSDFEIYEDLEVDQQLEEEDEDYAEIEDEDEKADDIAYDSTNSSAYDSDTSVKLPASKVIAEQSAARVDTRGRTRAATTQRKTQGVSEFILMSSFSGSFKKNSTVGNNKRRRNSTQGDSPPKKMRSKKTM